MVHSNSTIIPELEQALLSVVSKRQYNAALQALEQAEGRVEALEQDNERLRNTATHFYVQNVRLESEKAELEMEKEELERRLRLQPLGSILLRPLDAMLLERGG